MTREDQASDECCLLRMASGAQSGLAPLYDRYGGISYSLALRITGDAQSSEEILHDVFIQLWRNASRLATSHGSIVVFLLAETRRRAICQIRNQAVQNCEWQNESSSAFCPAILPRLSLEVPVVRDRISTALADLPEIQRKALTLAYFEGLTVEEIAHQTGLTSQAIKSELRIAFKRIRTVLNRPEAVAVTDNVTTEQATNYPPMLGKVFTSDSRKSASGE